MKEFMNIYVDEDKAIIILSYASGVYDNESLTSVQEDLEKAYGYTVLLMPNATLTLV